MIDRFISIYQRLIQSMRYTNFFIKGKADNIDISPSMLAGV